MFFCDECNKSTFHHKDTMLTCSECCIVNIDYNYLEREYGFYGIPSYHYKKDSDFYNFHGMGRLTERLKKLFTMFYRKKLTVPKAVKESIQVSLQDNFQYV